MLLELLSFRLLPHVNCSGSCCRRMRSSCSLHADCLDPATVCELISADVSELVFRNTMDRGNLHSPLHAFACLAWAACWQSSTGLAAGLWHAFLASLDTSGLLACLLDFFGVFAVFAVLGVSGYNTHSDN